MGLYNFRDDLPVARLTEKEVAKLLEERYNAEILEFGVTKKHDIKAKIRGKEYTFEVKEDFYCKKSGNVAVEFESRGKLSGIQTSESDFYIYKIHTKDHGIKFILIKTEDLKKIIEEKRYFRVVNGGDTGSNTMNYLFKYDVFIKHGRTIKEIL